MVHSDFDWLSHLESTALSTVSGVKIFSLAVSWRKKRIIFFHINYYVTRGSIILICEDVGYTLSFWPWQTSEDLRVTLAAARQPPWSPVHWLQMRPPDPQPAPTLTDRDGHYNLTVSLRCHTCMRVWRRDLVWLEVDISQMKDRGQHPVDAGLLLWSEA